MDVALEQHTPARHYRYNLVSILVLVDVALEPPSRGSRINPRSVSILVLVDVALERDGTTPQRGDAIRVSILVLVDVALELDAYGGTMTGLVGFQSLFSWMSLLNSAYRFTLNPFFVFQSLFSWMSLLNRQHRVLWIALLGFNPCSRGCRS